MTTTLQLIINLLNCRRDRRPAYYDRTHPCTTRLIPATINRDRRAA